MAQLLRLVLMLGLAALWPAMAAAQSAVLRSGEHEGFTRLVIDLPIQGSAVLEQTGREVTVLLAQPVAGFDTSGVFRRIGNDRIASVRALEGGRGVALTLACDCTALLFSAGPRMLAVDVSAGPAPEEVGVPVAAARESQILPVIPDNPVRPPPDLPLPDLEQLAMVREAEKRILEQLGRAASQGLLTPQRGTSAPLGSAEPMPADAPEPRPAPVRVQTARDAALEGDRRPQGHTLSGRRCPDDAEFAVAGWGGNDFITGLGQWRSRQFGEFDRPDPEAAQGLARHYIRYGFGAEALQTLKIAGVEGAVLGDMAAIVDGAQDRLAGVLNGFETCAGDVALWALLSSPQNPQPQADAEAVSRAFLALPDDLQRRLGPDVAQALALSGMADAGGLILRRLGAAGHSEDPAVQFGAATLRQGKSDDTAVSDLAPVVAANTALSAQALSRMIAAELDAGRPVSPETAELAAAFAFEHRDGPEARALLETEILARAASGAFAAALKRAEAAPGVLSSTLLARVVDLLTAQAPDAEFLSLIMIHSDMAAQVPAATGNAVAARLLSLGFAEQMALWLGASADGPEGQARKLLRARAALAQSLPRRAEAELLGLDTGEADLLRARAREMAGDFAEAARIYERLDAGAEEQRADFRAEDWARLATRDGSALGDVARLKTATRPEDLTGILARNRALLEESAAVREALDRMLREIADTPGG